MNNEFNPLEWINTNDNDNHNHNQNENLNENLNGVQQGLTYTNAPLGVRPARAIPSGALWGQTPLCCSVPQVTQGAGVEGERERERESERESERERNGFERLVAAIENSGMDITTDYTDWFRIGVAIAGEYGESGRDYYHRISKLYNNYNYTDTDNKYNQCLKDTNKSITLGTVYHLAKNAGITLPHPTKSVSVPQCAGVAGVAQIAEVPVARENTAMLPHFGIEVSRLVPFMRDIYRADSNPSTADMLVFGSVIALSSVMPNVCGVYGRKRVYANLFGFVAAPPASSKGKLADVIRIVQPIQDEIRAENELDQFKYQEQLAAYKAAGDKTALPPTPPKYKTLKIAANASATAAYQTLSDNDGCGFTAETEGDTLTMMMKSDFGNYSDGLRKAFHHESISYMRRKENEHVDITHPRWSVLLSGTYGQISTLIPNPENGLFSRFPFYCLPRTYEWINVFDATDETLENLFFALGRRFLPLYHVLKGRAYELLFDLTAEQQIRFNEHFQAVQQEYVGLYGDDLVASVRRQGLIAYRIMMVLSVLRYVDQPQELSMCDAIRCNDDDYEVAIGMIDVLLQHTAYVFANCLSPIESAVSTSQLTNQQQLFYNTLPARFTSKERKEVAEKLHINERTAERWVGQMLTKYGMLSRPEYGVYEKVLV